MTRPPRSTSQAAYARAVERLWADCLERPVILSARDWALITDWHARRVPLQVVREALEALAERRGKSPPRGLAAIAGAVEESWAAIAGGRVVERSRPETTRPPARDPLDSWRACSERLSADSEIGGLVRELLARHSAGTPAADVDAALDTGLCELAPAVLRRSAERQVDELLEPFRPRMPAAAWHDTRRRAIADRLRRRLGLERVAAREHSP